MERFMFIEITDNDGKRHLINVDYIEEIVESEGNGCTIYLAFNSPAAIQQDYIETEISYDEVVALISEGGVE